MKEKSFIDGDFKITINRNEGIITQLEVKHPGYKKTFIMLRRYGDKGYYECYFFNEDPSPIVVGKMLLKINEYIPKGLQILDYNISVDAYMVLLTIAIRKDWKYELCKSQILNSYGNSNDLSIFYSHHVDKEDCSFRNESRAYEFKQKIDEVFIKHKLPYTANVKKEKNGKVYVRVPSLIITRL